MKLLKSGYLPRYWYGKCDYCGAIFEFDREEDCKYLPDIEFTWKRLCPECNKTYIKFYRSNTAEGRELNKMYKY